MPTEAELEQLFVRVSELEAWRKVQQGEIKKEVPKEPAAKVEPPKAAPFPPPIPPHPPTPPKNESNTTHGTQNQASKK